MGWHLVLTAVTNPSLAYIILGGFVAVFSTISLFIKDYLYVNEVVLGTAFGVLMGPHCANIFNPRSWGAQSQEITLEVMRIVLAVGLFCIGVALPRRYLKDHAKDLLVMVVPTMAFGWFVVAAMTFALFTPIDFISALAIAACLTPTDPIICSIIVGGKWADSNVGKKLRDILSAESAANDGMAYPFLSISLYLATEASRGTAFAKWVVVGCLYQVILGTILGAAMGLLFSKIMKFAQSKGLIDRDSYTAQYVALAIFTIGVVSSLGSDDLLAAFAAGSAISWDGCFAERTSGDSFPTVIDFVLNCGCFVYIGAWLPFDAFNSPQLGITPWRLVALLAATLVLRRIPALLVLRPWMSEVHGWREALFAGHFGPMGVSAIFVSTLARTRLPTPHDPPRDQQELLAAALHPVVAFVVLGSIVVHGLSIPAYAAAMRAAALFAPAAGRKADLEAATPRDAPKQPDACADAEKAKAACEDDDDAPPLSAHPSLFDDHGRVRHQRHWLDGGVLASGGEDVGRRGE